MVLNFLLSGTAARTHCLAALVGMVHMCGHRLARLTESVMGQSSGLQAPSACVVFFLV